MSFVTNFVTISLLFLVGYNFSFWQATTIAYPLSLSNMPFLLALGVFISSVYYLVLNLFSFKYVFKPLLITILFIAAVSAYSMDSYGYVISSATYHNLLATDKREIFDLLSWGLLIYVLILFIVPSVWLILSKIIYPSWRQRFISLLVIISLIFVNLIIFNKNYASMVRNHKNLHYYINPSRPLDAMAKYLIQKYKNTDRNHEQPFEYIDPYANIAHNTGKPRLVILVIGEADRALNHSLNGYARNTEPLLSLRSDVYSFKNFTACGTETSISVPCMFSSSKREDFNFKKYRYTENLLDILQKLNIQVLWRDNDSGCKDVCNRVAVDDFNDAKIEPYCNNFECHDEVLLHKLQDYINLTDQDKLIILHKKGNHGPAYYKRYPAQFEVFTPVCRSNELQQCTKQEILNAYDNIILYTDYLLDKIIAQLQANNKYQTALIYVSDHGESLGEKGIYLHGMPYWLAPKEQLHIPFIFWASKDFLIDQELLFKLEQQELSHDNLFHTILGLFNINSKVYETDLDLFASKA